MKSFQNLSLISLVILALASCVTTRSELNEKRDQQSDSSSVVSENLQTSEPAVVEKPKTEETVTARPSPLIPVPANSQYGMEEMKAELAKLSGKIEEIEQEKKTEQTTQLEEQKKLQAKIDDLEKKLKEKEEQNNGPVVPEGKTPLMAAKDAFFSSKYEVAIQFLDPFLKSNESGKEAEEGTFIRGESYFKLKQYKKAIVDYSKFPEKFPKSNYNSKALLKIAESFDALDMKEDAKAFYQDLFDKYPKTVEGKLAKKKLSGKTNKK